MRKWWKKVGFIAGGLVSLGGLASAAQAQSFGGPPPGSCSGSTFAGAQDPICGSGAGGALMQQPSCGAPPVTLPNDGTPNAWADVDCCHSFDWPKVWFGAEGFVGFIKRPPLNVPLVTTSTNPTQTSNDGAIGQPSTVILGGLGGVNITNPGGMRLTLGICPTENWLVPLEVVYLGLHERSTVFADSSDITGNPLLARPVLATQGGGAGTEIAYLSSFPGLATGSVNIDSSLLLWGLQVQGVVRTGLQWGDDCCGLAIDLPVGFRYLNLEDTINITSTTAPISTGYTVPFLGMPFGPGNRVIVTDMFKGNNEFRGGEFGVRFDARWDRLFLTVEPRIDIGSTSQNVIVNGVSSLEQPFSPTATTPGGILAVSTNGGSHERDRFTALPEGDVKLGWDCFSWLRLEVGYNLAYWSNVERAGNQISNAVDGRQVPTDPNYTPGATNLAGPYFTPKQTSFFIQGVTAGIVISY